MKITSHSLAYTCLQAYWLVYLFCHWSNNITIIESVCVCILCRKCVATANRLNYTHTKNELIQDNGYNNDKIWKIASQTN